MIQPSEIKTKQKTKPRDTFDSPWKSMLNRFLREFMEFCFPHIAEEIDWAKEFIPLDKELRAMRRDQEIGNRITDALFKIWLKTGEEVWVLFHIEVQAEPETGFEERMFIYNYRGFEQYKKPVFSIAILTDESPNWRPTEYRQPSPFTFHTSNFLHFGFSTIKLLDYMKQKEALLVSANPFALIIWAHLEGLKTRTQSENRLQSKLKITRVFYERGFSKAYVQGLFLFVDWVLYLPEAQGLTYLKEVQRLEGENQVEYITSVERIGIEKGMQKGESILLIRQLQHRFGHLPDMFRQKIEKSDSESLLLWGEKMLDVKSLDELFE